MWAGGCVVTEKLLLLLQVGEDGCGRFVVVVGPAPAPAPAPAVAVVVAVVGAWCFVMMRVSAASVDSVVSEEGTWRQDCCVRPGIQLVALL